MYWKLEKSGCSVRNGTVQLRFDCYLDDEQSPFVCHFRRFPYTVTDEEIMANGEQILDMAYKNLCNGTLHNNTNPDEPTLRDEDASTARLADILATDFEALFGGSYKLRS